MQEAEALNVVTSKASAQIVVHEADTLMGMRRGQLSAAADGEKDPILWWGKAIMYPDCLACSDGAITLTVPVKKDADTEEPAIKTKKIVVAVKDLTFDQFMALPDQITEAWLGRVYETNPHWSPALPSKEAQEKKA